MLEVASNLIALVVVTSWKVGRQAGLTLLVRQTDSGYQTT